MSGFTQQLLNSYTRGIGKSMDMQNKYTLFSDISSVSLGSAWKNIGTELKDVMSEYSKLIEQSTIGLGDLSKSSTTTSALERYNELIEQSTIGLGDLSKSSTTTTPLERYSELIEQSTIGLGDLSKSSTTTTALERYSELIYGKKIDG